MTIPPTALEEPARSVPAALPVAPESNHCVECATPIGAGVRICPQCKAHQDRRRYLVLAGMIIPLLVGIGAIAKNFTDLANWVRDWRAEIKVVVAKPECSKERVMLTLVNHGRSQVLVQGLGLSVWDDGVLRKNDLKVVADSAVVKPGDSTKMTITANVDDVPIIFPTRRSERCVFDLTFDLVSDDKRESRKVRCDCQP